MALYSYCPRRLYNYVSTSEKIVGECERMCISHKLLIVNMLSILSDRAMMLNRKVEYLAIKTIRGKLSTYLLEQYKNTGNRTFYSALKS